MVSFQHAFYIISKFALQRGVLVAQFDNTVHVINDFKQLSNGDIILMRQRNVVVGVCHTKNEAYNRLILDIKTKNKGYDKILSMYVMLKTAMKLRAYWKDYKDFAMHVIILRQNITIKFTSFEEVTALIKEDLHLLLKPTLYNVCRKGKVAACNAYGGTYVPKNNNCKTGMNKSHDSPIYDENDTYDEIVVKTHREREKENTNQVHIEKSKEEENKKLKKDAEEKQIQERKKLEEEKRQEEEKKKEDEEEKENAKDYERILYEEKDQTNKKNKGTLQITRRINAIISNIDYSREYIQFVNKKYYSEVYINNDFQLLKRILLIFQAQLPNIAYNLFKNKILNNWLLVILINVETKCFFEESFDINETTLKKITDSIETCHKHNLTHGNISLGNYIFKQHSGKKKTPEQQSGKNKIRTPILTCFNMAKESKKLKDLDWHCLYVQLRADIHENRRFIEINNLILLSDIMFTRKICELSIFLFDEFKKVEEMKNELKKIK